MASICLKSENQIAESISFIRITSMESLSWHWKILIWTQTSWFWSRAACGWML